MKQILVITAVVFSALAGAGSAQASGPTPCDIDQNSAECADWKAAIQPSPSPAPCDPYGPQPVPVECRDDDIPRRDDSVFPERIPAATNYPSAEPVALTEPAQLPNTGAGLPLQAATFAGLSGAYYGIRRLLKK